MDEELSILPGEPTATVSSAANMYVAYAFLGILALIVVVVFLSALKRRLNRPETYGLTREELAKRWLQVRSTSHQGLMGAKLAIMEADTLLDAALRSLMMPGDTLGDRLKVACYKYEKLREVWWAHKLRNQLAHESSFQVSEREAQRALDAFERAFKTLNLM